MRRVGKVVVDQRVSVGRRQLRAERRAARARNISGVLAIDALDSDEVVTLRSNRRTPTVPVT